MVRDSVEQIHGDTIEDTRANVARRPLLLRCVTVALLALLAAACSQTPPETRLVRRAAEALGGAERIQAVKTLVIEGEGVAGYLGQDSSPDVEQRNWKVTEYKQSLDLGNGRWVTQQVRIPMFPYPNPNVWLKQGLDGDVTYNIGGIGGSRNNAVRASAMVARDRRLEAFHHPLTAIRAALDPASQVRNFSDRGPQQSVDITTAKGDTFTLTVDGSSGRPASVTSTAYDPNLLGDVVIQTTFGSYAEAGGLNLPRRLTTKLDQSVQLDLTVTSNSVNVDVGDLAAPAGVVAAAEPPMLPVYEIMPRQISRGIWLLPGSHHSVLLEFADHLTLVEAPLNENRALALIAAARALVPNKPLTHVIITHHHLDHSGGLRAMIANGMTIIAHRSMEGFVDRMAKRVHTIVPDELAKAPKAAKVDFVDDQMILKDEAMEVRLYHVKNNEHATSMLMALVPKEGLMIQADLYVPTFATAPQWDSFQQNIAERGLKIERHLPLHGQPQTAKEAAEAVAKQRSR